MTTARDFIRFAPGLQKKTPAKQRTSVRIRIPVALVPRLLKAIEFDVGNSRALAASFDVCFKQSAEPFFKKGAEEERREAQELQAFADRIWALAFAREPKP